VRYGVIQGEGKRTSPHSYSRQYMEARGQPHALVSLTPRRTQTATTEWLAAQAGRFGYEGKLIHLQAINLNTQFVTGALCDMFELYPRKRL